jgi:hypothetical protein
VGRVLHGEGVFAYGQPPRSAVLTEARAADGRGQVVRGLRGGCLIEFIFAAGAQAVLPTVPAPELVVTAQTRGISGIRVGFRGSAMGAFPGPFVTHDGPQRYKVFGEGFPGMRIGQEPCHRLACSAADPPARSKPVRGAARSRAATPGPWPERRRHISEVRRAQHTRGGQPPPRWPEEWRELTSYGWDTCAEMSQLSTAWMSALHCLCCKRNRRRLAPTLADRPR